MDSMDLLLFGRQTSSVCPVNSASKRCVLCAKKKQSGLYSNTAEFNHKQLNFTVLSFTVSFEF